MLSIDLVSNISAPNEIITDERFPKLPISPGLNVPRRRRYTSFPMPSVDATARIIHLEDTDDQYSPPTKRFRKSWAPRENDAFSTTKHSGRIHQTRSRHSSINDTELASLLATVSQEGSGLDLGCSVSTNVQLTTDSENKQNTRQSITMGHLRSRSQMELQIFQNDLIEYRNGRCRHISHPTCQYPSHTANSHPLHGNKQPWITDRPEGIPDTTPIIDHKSDTELRTRPMKPNSLSSIPLSISTRRHHLPNWNDRTQPNRRTRRRFTIEPLLNVNDSVFITKGPEDIVKDVYVVQASRILPFLYLGNEIDGTSEQILKTCQIHCVLNVTPKAPFLDEEQFFCRRLVASDLTSQDMRPLFQPAFQFIEEARRFGRTVLVHCKAGVSRSPALVIAYLMAHSKLSLRDAYLFVKSRRSVISPNLGFLGQLSEFESELMAGHQIRQPEILGSLSHSAEVNGAVGNECADDLISMLFDLPTEPNVGIVHSRNKQN